MYWDGRSWVASVAAHGPRGPRRRDTIWSVLALALAIVLSVMFGVWSLFAMMIPADGCPPAEAAVAASEQCNANRIDLAYRIIWWGLPIAIVGGSVGTGIAALLKRPTWPPAVASLIAVVACIVAWFALMKTSTPASMW